MRYGVLSDIHGNLEAFQTALARLKKEGAEQYIFCGDLIGYGPDPEACVQLYRSLTEKNLAIGVVGNHDAIFSHPEMQAYFHPDALEALEWSRKELSKESLRLISFLPEIIKEKDFTIVHGTPSDPIKEYFASATQFKQSYSQWTGQILFVGHSHIPFCMEGTQKQCQVHLMSSPGVISIQQGVRYVINPGSVGKPRDNDTRASFGLWDTEQNEFFFMREPYDAILTQKKMAAAGLPEFLVDSLSIGI